MRGTNYQHYHSIIPPILATVAPTRLAMSLYTSTVDNSIRTSLLSLQSSFFQSLHGGAEALAAFDHELTSFQEAVSRSEPHLEEETRLLIYSFVQTSDAVIPSLIDLDIASEKIIQEEGDKFNKLIDGLSLDDPYTGLFPLPF